MRKTVHLFGLLAKRKRVNDFKMCSLDKMYLFFVEAILFASDAFAVFLVMTEMAWLDAG